jgi:stearoyl-CoA desaturase (delta-9 desaturase)
LTAFYHRYFSHRAFKTSRWFQCVGAILGLAAIQRGPLWWAAHHRKHHRHSDDPEDLHSPYHGGFWWSHIGWFLTKEHFKKNLHEIKDFTKYPELRFLDHYEMLVPTAMGIGLYLLGEGLALWKPEWGCTGLQMFVWGFLISTVAVYHVTYTINSLCHLLGRRRYQTRDQSRNNLVLALLTFGEGWHNNHHRYPSSARQGFFWWEIDITYYTLVVLSWFGLVWDLRPVPQHVLTEHQRREGQASPQANA